MACSGKFTCSRGLREICRKKISEEFFTPLKTENEFKLIIVDDFALKILSYCFTTEEVLSFNIALFEYLDEIREPVPYLSAVYLFFPSSENITLLVNDLVSSPPKYLNVYLFFLSDVKQEAFDEIVKSSSAGFVQNFKEIDILFVPYESQVFSLNDEKFLPVFLDAYKEMDLEKCACFAKKLATLCAALKIFPRIRYRREHINNMLLAVALERELHFYLEFTPSRIQSDTKRRVELLIIDRGFDCVTPLVHDYTFQAMAQDLLDIEDDVYEYLEDQSFTVVNRSRVSLTEPDLLWCKLRHKYAPDVTRIIDETVEMHGLLRRYLTLAPYKTVPQLGDAVRKKLAYRKNQPHGRYKRMANECMRLYYNGINEVANLMQELALGTITENSFSQDVRSAVLNILRNSNYDLSEKLRLFLLYIFYAKGITKSEFDDIIVSSELPFEASVVTNILHLDVDIFRPGSCQAVDYIPRDDVAASTSLPQRSNWIPAIKNVMLSCIDGTLSEDKYPYLQTDDSVTRSEKTGYQSTDRSAADQMPNLIVFIAGGVTYSEMRYAYEVMSLHRGLEVYIGGDSILTPKKFLDKLGELRCLITKYM